MDKILLLISFIAAAIFCFTTYHKIFDVTYFGAGGCLKELLWCGIGGIIIASLLQFSTVAQIIGTIVLLALSFGGRKRG